MKFTTTSQDPPRSVHISVETPGRAHHFEYLNFAIHTNVYAASEERSYNFTKPPQKYARLPSCHKYCACEFYLLEGRWYKKPRKFWPLLPLTYGRNWASWPRLSRHRAWAIFSRGAIFVVFPQTSVIVSRLYFLLIRNDEAPTSVILPRPDVSGW